MKSFTAALLGGAALVTVGAATSGAYYASNHILPERIAAEMNAAMDDALAQNVTGNGIQISKSGSITVESAGFLKYKATMPAITVQQSHELTDISIIVKQAEYDLTIVNPVDAAAAVLSGDTFKARMVSTQPVPVTAIASMLGSGEEAVFEGLCASMQNDMVLGGGYTVDTAGTGCEIKSTVTGGHTRADISSHATFRSQVTKDGNGYSGGASVSLTNFRIAGFDERGNAEGTITAEQIDFAASYGGMPSVTGKSVTELTVEDMPNDFAMSVDFGKVALSLRDMPFELPTVSFNAGFDMKGLKGDAASVDIHAGYAIDELPRGGMVLSSEALPEKSACSFGFGGIPAKGLSEVVSKIAKGEAASGGTLAIEQALSEVLAGSNIAVGIDCESSKGSAYRSTLNADHTLVENSFPGKGKLEMHGIRPLFEDLSALIGPQAEMLMNVFTQIAKPTEDGNGLVIEYELDRNNNLTVNGQPMGPIPGIR